MSERAFSRCDPQSERENSPISFCISSSQETTSSRLDSRKEKRQPSITPRKFNRFFSPRSHVCLPIKLPRGALTDITVPANNQDTTQSSPMQPSSNGREVENSPTVFTREMKRRKLLHTSRQSPDETGSEKQSPLDQHHIFEDSSSNPNDHSNFSQRSISARDSLRRLQDLGSSPLNTTVKQIRQLEKRGLNGGLLQSSLRSSTTFARRCLYYPDNDWRAHTAGFYSGPDDIHFCTSIGSHVRSIPFCTASCNTNSLVAVGDEEGYVRLLESAKDAKPQFKDVFLAFRPHSNAVIDMSFSLDDSLLVTASGDQTARVVDMTTQTTISSLAQHSASLKQARFQPGVANNSVVATSSRDGSVQIWDLRCKGAQATIHDFRIPMDSASLITPHSGVATLNYGCIVNTIYDAHRLNFHRQLPQSNVSRDGPSRGELPGRLGDVSVTAIAFLPQGQEHMLLTASEANASIKLWDIRCLHHTRKKTATPISCTALPESHNQWRHFGTNSLCLNGNGTRIYALCRDNSVYAYSTAHLILGQAPELSANKSRWRQQLGDVREGLGPLYGLRHRQLHATSFYVKAAIRPSKAGKTEMLAVGSCDGCSIIFPTDERYIERGEPSSTSSMPEMGTPSRVRQSPSNIGTSLRSHDNFSISENGTPLVRGHDKEVGALTWTSDGELVTVGDDFLVRCWREGSLAHKLRMGGEEGGQRWGCGWADVPELYDDDDEDLYD